MFREKREGEVSKGYSGVMVKIQIVLDCVRLRL
nr:MAG TPA: hypothetical protein [Caudoviricetes sp.]